MPQVKHLKEVSVYQYLFINPARDLAIKLVPLDWTRGILAVCGVIGTNDPTEGICSRFHCHHWHLQAAFQVIHSLEQTFMASS